MKRILFAAIVAALAAGLVASVFSPAFVDLWRHYEFVQGVIPFLAYPTMYFVGPLLGFFGINAATSATPLVASAFIQWLLAGYLIGGVFFRDKESRTSPGGLKG